MEEQELQSLLTKHKVADRLKLAVDLLYKNHKLEIKITKVYWFIGLLGKPRCRIEYLVDNDYDEAINITEEIFTAEHLLVDDMSKAGQVANRELRIVVRLAYLLYAHRYD